MLLDGRLWMGAGQAVHQLSALENQQRGDSLNLESAGRSLVFIGVELCDHVSAGSFPGQLFQRRRYRAAGGAPRRPEIDQHRPAVSDNAVKVGVCSRDGMGTIDGCRRQLFSALPADGLLAVGWIDAIFRAAIGAGDNVHSVQAGYNRRSSSCEILWVLLRHLYRSDLPLLTKMKLPQTFGVGGFLICEETPMHCGRDAGRVIVCKPPDPPSPPCP
jgi:hypothetical protein